MQQYLELAVLLSPLFLKYAVTIIALFAICAAASFTLWVFFLAVMKLRDVRDSGKLNGQAKYPAYLVLFIGYILDFVVNMIPATVVFLEIPQELTVSERTKRHRDEPTWRGAMSRWLRKGFLSIADTSGGDD